MIVRIEEEKIRLEVPSSYMQECTTFGKVALQAATVKANISISRDLASGVACCEGGQSSQHQEFGPGTR